MVPAVVCGLAFVLTTAYIGWQRWPYIKVLCLRVAMLSVGSLASWYRFTQWLSPRGKRVPIPRDYTSLGQITEDLRTLPYEYDPEVLKGVSFDSLTHPGHTFWLAAQHKDPVPGALPPPGLLDERKGGDCDDSAGAWCAALVANAEALGIVGVQFGACLYLDEKNVRRGHALCLFVTGQGGVFHVGNWYGNAPVRAGSTFPEALKGFVSANKYTWIVGGVLEVLGLAPDESVLFGRGERVI